MTTWNKELAHNSELRFDADEYDTKFAVALTSNTLFKDTTDYNDPDYATLSVFTQEYTLGNKPLREEVTLTQCNEDYLSFSKSHTHTLGELFGHERVDEVKEKLLPNFQCIQDPDFSIHGGWTDLTKADLKIRLERCNPDERSTCKSDAEFEEWIEGKSISIIHSHQEFQVD